MRVRYSAGCKRRAVSLAQFLCALAVASAVPVDSFELLVLHRSDWQARVSAPYGLPLARRREGRVIAAADYPERLVNGLDDVLMDAANRGVDAPSGWRELFDVLIGVRWAQVVMPSDLHTGVFWLDALLAQMMLYQACAAGDALDTARLQQWWQVCAVGKRKYVTRAPQRPREVMAALGHWGLISAHLVEAEDDAAFADIVRALPRERGKAEGVTAKKKLEHWLEHTSM